MASVLDLVKHYQHAVEKYPNDEQKILKCIDKLFNLAVTVQHLQETGVGRTVNALRKEPGAVGQAARALVYKWKMMVAAEESDEEGDHDTSNYNGHGKDTDDSQTRTKYDESPSQNINQKNYEQSNGNHSGTKRNYHSSEDDEPNRKKTKCTNSGESDGHKRSYTQVKSEDSENDTDEQDTENSDTEESESESSESSVEDTKANRKIKTEPVEKDRSLKCLSNDSHEVIKKESSSSKKSYESSKNSSHHSSQSKYSSEKHASREKSHSSDKSSTKSKSHSSHEKFTEKEKSTDKKHKSTEKEKSHKDESSSSDKYHSSSQKHKSSSQNLDNESERNKNHSDKPKSDKHNSHSIKKEKHKSSSENEIPLEKSKPKSSSGSSKDKDKHSSSRDKESKNKSKESSSKDSLKDNKIDKKHSSSSDTKLKSTDKKSEKSDHSSEKKNKNKSDTSSSHKSSKSSRSKSKKIEEVPKKKAVPPDGEESDDGIDCGSGASFAEALGMVSPAKPKKKSAAMKNTVSPNNNFNDLSPAALLSASAKLAPLPALEISALPEISPNYKPRPPPKLLPHFSEEEAISVGISSKNQRTKVYSGNKTYGKMRTLFEMCVQVLQEHIDALEYTGGVPYEILKPVVDKATPQQLFMLEHYNPYLMDDTDHLWQTFCNKSFRNKHRQELETWREMYMRCQEEQECKLKSLTENIKIAQEAKRAPIKQTKMAYVDTMVKPPRNIARKQALHGTAHSASASPAARVAALATTPNVLKGSVRPSPAAPVSSSTFNKPKKAPLMQKALQFMRGRKR